MPCPGAWFPAVATALILSSLVEEPQAESNARTYIIQCTEARDNSSLGGAGLGLLGHAQAVQIFACTKHPHNVSTPALAGAMHDRLHTVCIA